MYKLGGNSIEKLNTCHEDLKSIATEVIKIIDFTVLEGHRTQERQIELYKEGKSKMDGINKKSKHQSEPSIAFDIAPYPVDFSDKEKSKARFYYLAGIVKHIAYELFSEKKISHNIRWGGDWNSDNDFNDQTFDDLVHFELI